MLVIPTPGEICLTIQAVSKASEAFFNWLQTDQGVDVVQKALDDRENWDKFWNDIGKGAKKFFNGSLFSLD